VVSSNRERTSRGKITKGLATRRSISDKRASGLQGVVVRKEQITISRTRLDMALLVKYFFGPIILIPAILSAKGLFEYPARIAVIIPLMLLGIFCMTSAEVRAGENALKYRRFLSWKQISFEQIVTCENSWNPWFGYLKLDRFVLPWGRLYFVKLRPAFSGDPKGLIEFINSKRAGIERRLPVDGSNTGENRAKSLGFFIFFLFVGFMISLMYFYLTPVMDQQSQLASFQGAAGLYLKCLHAAVNWPWGLGTVAIMILTIVTYRSRNLVWIPALAAGTILGNILARAFH
jgi:hypothetical protein